MEKGVTLKVIPPSKGSTYDWNFICHLLCMPWQELWCLVACKEGCLGQFLWGRVWEVVRSLQVVEFVYSFWWWWRDPFNEYILILTKILIYRISNKDHSVFTLPLLWTQRKAYFIGLERRFTFYFIFVKRRFRSWFHSFYLFFELIMLNDESSISYFKRFQLLFFTRCTVIFKICLFSK